MTIPSTANRFDAFFADPLYLSLKPILFSYRYRKWRISRHAPESGRILDIGSGTAPVSPDLSRTVVADLSEEALRNVVAPEKIVASITALPFAPVSFDCILCSEVLEHVQDDLLGIREMRRVLKGDGVLVVTVPYQQRFWAEDDEYVGHVRRYEPGELEAKLRACGFSSVATYRLAGRIERWLTRGSLRMYNASGPRKRLPLRCLRLINHALFALLVVTGPFTRWNQTTRILIVAR
jgi:SAM-dependent methyltransferase